MYRMDHAYKRHRYWLKGKELQRLPSEYFRDHIALTFQDDWTAFQFADQLGPHQLMWANDFPHSDSTWPWSQDVLAAQTGASQLCRSGPDPPRQRRRAVRARAMIRAHLPVGALDSRLERGVWGVTYKYASPAAFGRRLAAEPFSSL